LTAKPQLTYGPDFYRDVFALVRRDVPHLSVEIIPSPTVAGQIVIGDIASAIRSILPRGQVELPEPLSLFGVYQGLRKAAVLFGPDTFSAHLAAAQGIPQVTISLAEHRPWVTLGSPCLSVSAEVPQRELVRTSAARLVALLQLPASSALRMVSTELRTHLRAVDQLTKFYLHIGRLPPLEEVVEQVRKIRVLYTQAAVILAPIARLQSAEATAVTSFDPAVYRNPEDMTRALVRWYHRIGISEVLGLTIAVTSC
jgi:hypothetical protein